MPDYSVTAAAFAVRAVFHGYLASLTPAADKFHAANNKNKQTGYSANPVCGAGTVTKLVVLVVNGGTAPAGKECPAGYKQHPASAGFAVNGT